MLLDVLNSNVAVRKNNGTFALTGQASRLLEQLAVCVKTVEPVLLVGETGCGKTTVIQSLADRLGQELVVQNLNIQSDSSELLGGYKPVELREIARPLYMEFLDLFQDTFDVNKNMKFIRNLFLYFLEVY